MTHPTKTAALTHEREETLLKTSWAMVATLADRGYTPQQIKKALNGRMIDAYLAIREKKDLSK
jgi:hypothetical protein